MGFVITGMASTAWTKFMVALQELRERLASDEIFEDIISLAAQAILKSQVLPYISTNEVSVRVDYLTPSITQFLTVTDCLAHYGKLSPDDYLWRPLRYKLYFAHQHTSLRRHLQDSKSLYYHLAYNRWSHFDGALSRLPCAGEQAGEFQPLVLWYADSLQPLPSFKNICYCRTYRGRCAISTRRRCG